MSRIDHQVFRDFLERYAEEERDVQLYDVFGHVLFPVWTPLGLSTDVAVFPLIRGTGEKAPFYTGAFPVRDGETIDIGSGWIAMCVILRYGDTVGEKIAKLELAENKLRAMRSGNGGN